MYHRSGCIVACAQTLCVYLPMAALFSLKWRWRHGRRPEIMMSNQKPDSVNRRTFTWRTFVPNFITIQFEIEMKDPQTFVMAGILKVWRHIRKPTPPIDVHLLEVQSHQISLQFNLKRWRLMLFWGGHSNKEKNNNKKNKTSSDHGLCGSNKLLYKRCV